MNIEDIFEYIETQINNYKLAIENKNKLINLWQQEIKKTIIDIHNLEGAVASLMGLQNYKTKIDNESNK